MTTAENNLAETLPKVCSECGVEKPRAQFSRRSAAGDGRRGCCKACDRARQHAYYLRQGDRIRAAARERVRRDPEAHAARAKAWREANPERVTAYNAAYSERNREALRERWRQYHLRNRDRALEKSRLYAQRNRDYFNAWNRRWRKQNPELARVRSVAAKARVRGSREGRHGPHDISRIMKAQRGRCAYCPRIIRGAYQVDHIKPVSKGGTNQPRNTQLTCGPCNRAKKNLLPEDFARRIGLLI